MEEKDSNNTANQEFVISRVFDAPRNLVFQMWTELEHLKHWWGPTEFTFVSGNLDLRPGGAFHYSMRAEGGYVMWGKFVYREITTPEKIVFVNSFSDENGNTVRPPFSGEWPHEMLITVTFVENDGKTTVTLRSWPINATELQCKTFVDGFGSMKQGFGGTLDQLDKYLAKSQTKRHG